jgi:flagellar biosynthetic protein FliP
MTTSRDLPSVGPLPERLSLVQRLATACLTLALVHGTARADPPMAPLPDDLSPAVTADLGDAPLSLDHAVEPASLAAPVAGAGRALGPVSLGEAPARDATSAMPPGTNWTVLAAILGAFAVLALFRLRSAHRPRPLPPDVFDVLGEGSLGGQHAVRVVRFGPRTLLVGLSSSGSQTLAEIDDPAVTERIVAACLPRPTARGTTGIRSASAVGVVCLSLFLPATARGADAAAVNAPAVVPAVVADPGLTEPVAIEAPRAEAVRPEAAATGAGGPSGSAVPAVAPAGSVLANLPAGLLGERPLTAVLPSMLLLGVATLAPALLLMTTCFVRMSVVLTLVRQGLGAAQVPSNQILASLAIFLSALVMWPVWTQAWNAGVTPYQEGRLSAGEAFEQGGLPIRRWMAAQIEQAGNRDTMLLFLARHPAGVQQAATYDDVPLESLLPAFLVSELETAFTIGFRLLLPFLVLDILVATLVVSTGLVMLPPTLVSLPLKLLVFVAADGWTLVVQTLLSGIAVA